MQPIPAAAGRTLAVGSLAVFQRVIEALLKNDGWKEIRSWRVSVNAKHVRGVSKLWWNGGLKVDVVSSCELLPALTLQRRDVCWDSDVFFTGFAYLNMIFDSLQTMPWFPWLCPVMSAAQLKMQKLFWSHSYSSFCCHLVSRTNRLGIRHYSTDILSFALEQHLTSSLKTSWWILLVFLSRFHASYSKIYLWWFQSN